MFAGANFPYLASASAEIFVGSNNYSRFNARKPHPPLAKLPVRGSLSLFCYFSVLEKRKNLHHSHENFPLYGILQVMQMSQISTFYDLTIAFWQGLCVFTYKFLQFYCCELINSCKVFVVQLYYSPLFQKILATLLIYAVTCAAK